MADSRLKGGDWALLGFYYQMIATLGLGTLKNEASEPLQAVDENARSLITAFTNSKNTRIRFEDAGQDISISAGEHRLLFQTKYSDNQDEFDQSDFRKVLESFAYSLKYVDEHGGPGVYGCILLTNRFQHDAIKSIEDIVKNCRAALGWQANQMYPLPTDSIQYANIPAPFKEGRINHTGSVEELTAKWLSSYDKSGNITTLPEDELVECALRVLPGMHFVTEAHLFDLEQTFIKFAQKYGAQQREIQAAIEQLIGRLIRKISEKESLTHEDFVEIITGHRNAQDLTPTGIGEKCAKDWKDWQQNKVAHGEWIVPRRDIQDRIIEAINSGQRIILLSGEGGCGKTQLLVQMTEPKIEALRAGDVSDGFVVLKSCLDLKQGWLDQAISLWANRSNIPSLPFDSAYDRLRTANPTANHLLWVGFDGLDEDFPNTDVIKTMVEEVRSRQDVYLVMTSRRTGVSAIHDLLDPRRVFAPSGHISDIAEIRVDELDIKEVDQAIRDGTGIDITPYVDDSMKDSESNTVFESIATASSLGFTMSNPNILVHSLKHPRLLGASMLAEADQSGTLLAALNQDASAMKRIALHFLKQFFQKYKHRRVSLNLPFAYIYCALLRYMAQGTYNSGTRLTKNQWRSISEQESIKRPEADRLFQEAASGGLIVIEGKQGSDSEWRWKHSFVADYLRTEDEEDYCPDE